MFYYRAIVPTGLRPLYPSEDRKGFRREIRVSLNTSDKKEAVRLWHVHSLAMRSEFDAKRRELARRNEQARVKTFTQLGPEDVKRLMTFWGARGPANRRAGASQGV